MGKIGYLGLDSYVSNMAIFIGLIFYVKLISANSEAQKLPFLHSSKFNILILVDFSPEKKAKFT